MSRYRLSGAANEDLFYVFVQGLQQFGHRQAENYQAGIERTYIRLAEFPDIGRARSDVGPTVRTLSFKSHIILYRRDDEDGVRILRARNAKEDWMDDPLGDAP